MTSRSLSRRWRPNLMPANRQRNGARLSEELTGFNRQMRERLRADDLVGWAKSDKAFIRAWSHDAETGGSLACSAQSLINPIARGC